MSITDERAFDLVSEAFGPKPDCASDEEWRGMVEGSLLYHRAALAFALYDVRVALKETWLSRQLLRLCDALARVPGLRGSR